MMPDESLSVGRRAPESPRENRTAWIVMGGLFALAIVVRAVAALAIGVSAPLSDDEPEYYETAVHIAEGKGYSRNNPLSANHELTPTAYRVPGPSIVLAVGFEILGNNSPAIARLISAFIASFGPPLMYLLVRRAASPRAALLAGLACAVYPTYVYFSLRVFSQPYFVPMLLLGLLTTVWAIEAPSRWPSLIAGIVWGLTGMVRPEGFPIAALFTLYLFAKREWRRGAYIAIGAWIILTPWAIRNGIVLGRTVLLATEAGETLLGANNPHVLTNPDGGGLWKYPLDYPEYASQLDGISDEVDRDHKLNEIARDYLRKNPGDVPRLVSNKLIAWLRPVPTSGGLVRLLVIASYDTLLILLAIGLLTRQIKKSLLLDLVLMISFTFTVVTCVYWGNLTRGRLALEILWIPWGAVVAQFFIERTFSSTLRQVSDPQGQRPLS